MSFDAAITFLPCRDLDRAVAFYEEGLGCEVAVRQEGCVILRVTTGGYVGLCERPENVGATAGMILTLVTDEVDVVAGSITAAGGEVTVAPRHNPTYGIYQCFATDPDGNVLEIQRFDDPDWAG